MKTDPTQTVHANGASVSWFLALVIEADRHKGIKCSISISGMSNSEWGMFGLARYRYEELSPVQFESLVTDICRHVLGKATRGFAEGPDGGRDARFDGTANDFPSASSVNSDTNRYRIAANASSITS